MYICMCICIHANVHTSVCSHTYMHAPVDGSDGDKTNSLVGRPNEAASASASASAAAAVQDDDDDDDTAGMFVNAHVGEPVMFLYVYMPMFVSQQLSVHGIEIGCIHVCGGGGTFM